MARYIDADKVLDDMLCEMAGTGYQAMAMNVIKYSPTADVVPKSDVEKWFRECEELQGRMIELESEVAREIFEEIDELLVQNATMQIATSTLHCKLAELKKKYTESEGK